MTATKAVIFDLFGTLVRWPEGSTHRHVMADRLGVSYEKFRAAWSKTRDARDAGKMDSVGALRAACAELGVTVDDDRLAFAASAFTEFMRQILVPRDGASRALGKLRDAGVRIGLMSDAPREVLAVWPSTPLAPLVDRVVFSCSEGSIKPDPRLYAAIAARLQVDAEQCLYVGNGDRDELAGAVSAGMRAVLFTGPGELRGGEAATWQGPSVSSLDRIPELV